MVPAVISGCQKQEAPKSDTTQKSTERNDKFILLPPFLKIQEQSIELMKSSTDYKSGESEVFNLMYIKGEEVKVELDLSNLYATRYPDSRKVVFYPAKTLKLPEENEIIPFGFLHYFDDNTLNVFFQVQVSYSSELIPEETPSDSPPSSHYGVEFLDKEGKTFGLVRSRILNKSDLLEEEAFRKFDTSRRTVQIGTNSLDENKFLFIFLKIPGMDDTIFQIFQRWY